MEENDSIKLLRECDAGTKMAVSSFNEVIDKAKDDRMREMLLNSKKCHTELGNKIHELLLQYGSGEEEPNPIAKGMSWMKINMKTAMDNSDSVIADLIVDGCNMGVKSLYRYQNKYKGADDEIKKICNALIANEEKLTSELREYL